jgi:hypothetical protein
MTDPFYSLTCTVENCLEGRAYPSGAMHIPVEVLAAVKGIPHTLRLCYWWVDHNIYLS